MNTGLGIRPELVEAVMACKPAVDFLEAHSENYFQPSVNRDHLFELREHYPVSLHGVGLSLGRADDLDQDHLRSLRQLVNDLEPLLVSEHLAWSAYAHRQVPDLLPLPLTTESFATICQHVDQMQEALGRQILIENPSNYLSFERLQMPEPEFLNRLAEQTGCGLLIDVNNIFVSAINLGRSARAYLREIDPRHVGQMHLAGHIERTVGEHAVLIDTHNQTVRSEVWQLYDEALALFGRKPTAIEWDSDFPELDVLLDECASVAAHQAAVDTHRNSRVERPAGSESAPIPDDNELPSLATTQQDFLDRLLQQQAEIEGVTPAHARRIWVYQNNVFGALNDYLAEVYPATQGVVGADFFKYLCGHHIQQQPPSKGDIYHYGAHFGQSVAELEVVEELPYLLPLIELEWAIHKAYFATEGRVLDPSELDHDELVNLPVCFNTGVWIGSSSFPLAEIHRQSLPDFDGEVEIDLSQSQDSILVYKQQRQVHTQVIDADIAAFLQSLRKFDTLMQAIDANVGSLDSETLTAGLALCFELGLLTQKN